MRTSLTTCAIVILLISASSCSTRRTPDTPDRAEQWFCQSDVSGEGWDCVQSDELARNPVVTRLPPAPAPEPEPFSIDPPAPLESSDALLSEPLPEPRRQAASPVQPLPSATVDEEIGGPAAAPEPVEPAEPFEPAKPAERPAPADTAVAAVEPAADASRDTPPPPQSGSPENTIPKHIRLAYVPPEPTPLLELPPDYFVVQLLAMDTKEEIEAFVGRHRLRGISAARVENDNRLYYVLILGIYATEALAQEASTDLPPPLDTVEPWIRRLGSLQSAMLRADDVAGSARY